MNKYIKTFESFIDNKIFESDFLRIKVNTTLKKLLGDFEGKEIAGGIIIPLNTYNELEEEDKKVLNSSVGVAITFAEDLIDELTHKPNVDIPQETTPIKKSKKPFSFLRWSSSPEDDVKRNFSGHMQAWVDTEEEAWKRREEEERDGKTFLYEPKYDSITGMWNYDPEWGISGYVFKDEESFNNAMESIEEIAWHHKDNNSQDLCLFTASEVSYDSGYDGEDLFRDIEFISYVDEDMTYDDIKKLLE